MQVKAQAEMGPAGGWHSFRDNLILPTEGAAAGVQIETPPMKNADRIEIPIAFQVEPDISFILVSDGEIMILLRSGTFGKDGIDIVKTEC